MIKVIFTLIVLLVISVHAQTPSPSRQNNTRSAAVGRPFQPEDIYKLDERLTFYTLSPDGKFFAYTVNPPLASTVPKRGYMDALRMPDVYVVSTETGLQKRILSGREEAFGYTDFSWSPDGHRLTFLAHKGIRFQVRVWEINGRTYAVSPFYADYEHTFKYWPGLSVDWISERQLVVAMPAQDGRPIDDSFNGYAQPLLRGWKDRESGTRPSASVLESGLSPREKSPQSAFTVIDIQQRTQKIILKTSGESRKLALSPNRQYLALTELHPREHSSDQAEQASENPPANLIILSLREPYEFKKTSLPGILNEQLFKWSPDSQTVSFQRATSSGQGIYRYSLGNSQPDPITMEGRRATKLVWSRSAQPVVQFAAGSGSRSDWYAEERSGVWRNLTAGFHSVPSNLLSESGRDSLLTVVEGQLWRVFLDGSPPVPVLAVQDGSFSAIAWPNSYHLDARTNYESAVDEIIVLANDRDGSLRLVDTVNKKVTDIPRPFPGADVSDYHVGRNVCSFANYKEGRLSLRQVSRNQDWQIYRSDQSVRKQIIEGEPRWIDYTSRNGQKLKGLVLLPVGFRPGNRYPVVVWNYPGRILTGPEPRSTAMGPLELATTANGFVPLNLQLLASHGYLVLWPSMPLPPWGTANDNLPALTDGVLPAIDKVVELGWADPNRVGLMGHSYGGYGTYGLITQTNRFRAAVAMDGITDLMSDYGTLQRDVAYTDLAVGSFAWAESGQAALGAPPWRDPERYIRNSPLFFVEKVQTPLLIIHGEMDSVPIQQAEEFFSALKRLNKPARFVRYVGEHHVPGSPANVIDMWKQIYAWFDEFLMKPEKTEGSSPGEIANQLSHGVKQ